MLEHTRPTGAVNRLEKRGKQRGFPPRSRLDPRNFRPLLSRPRATIRRSPLRRMAAAFQPQVFRMPSSRFTGPIVALVAALVLLPNLGDPPLWDDDEPRNAACSLAMWQSGDWVVPTFNGRLRVEKPVLVNWLHMAGFALAGVNETGARLSSALLTLATCLLSWRIGRALFSPAAGLWAGVALATCLWTGATGRAATPDAPLAFCTTLALWFFIGGSQAAGPDGCGWRHGPVRLSCRAALGAGAACGLAVLAKGPVGVVLPLTAFLGFATWQAALDPGRCGPWAARWWAAFRDGCRGTRPLLILATALAVAGPWYALVTVRTGGEWPRDFLLVHNLGRFAGPMEGHSGSAFLYYPLVLLIGTFPWSMASALVGHHAVRTARSTAGRLDEPGMRLLLAWVAAWVVPFSLSGTKLPGYVWPAYPALAGAVGLFVADWIRRPSAGTDAWMRWSWFFLAASGVAIAIGLPIVTQHVAPEMAWLGLVGLVPLCGAAWAWACQSRGARHAAAGAWAAAACGTVGLLLAVGPVCLARAGGTRQLLAILEPHAALGPIHVGTYRAPPSTSFYAGRLTADGSVTELKTPAQVAAFLSAHPDAHLVVDSRFEHQVGKVLPPGHGVLDAVTSLPSARRLLLLGPPPAAPARPLAVASSELGDHILHR